MNSSDILVKTSDGFHIAIRCTKKYALEEVVGLINRGRVVYKDLLFDLVSTVNKNYESEGFLL